MITLKSPLHTASQRLFLSSDLRTGLQRTESLQRRSPAYHVKSCLCWALGPFMIWPHFTPHLCLPKPTNLCTSMTSCGRLLTTPSFTGLTACVAYRQADGTPARLLHSACPHADVAKTQPTYLHNISFGALLSQSHDIKILPCSWTTHSIAVSCTVRVRVRWLLSCVICSLSMSLSLSPTVRLHTR